MRIGHGYDVHRLVEGRKLILGGVEIEHRLGLDGHSDADVLVHAVMDALLGAAALGDIGKLFPDTDDTYLGIDSMILLSRVRDAIEAKGLFCRQCRCDSSGTETETGASYPCHEGKDCLRSRCGS